MCSYDERLKRGFNDLLAAYEGDTSPERMPDDLDEMPLIDVPNDRVFILPVVMFVMSPDEYKELCAGDEN